MILLHYTGMESGRKALSWLCDPQSEVSSHYFVHEDGRIVQMVPESMRAWHAGQGGWKREGDTNSRSIGIEMSNPGHDFGYPPFPDAQIEAVIQLCLNIAGRHAIPRENVLAHSDIAPGRKRDPGEKFPWRRLFDCGVGHFVDSVPITASGRFLSRGEEGQPIEALQSMLALYGYEIDVTGTFDQHTYDVVTAFQRHFRAERVDGIADISTIETLYRLILSIPEPDQTAGTGSNAAKTGL